MTEVSTIGLDLAKMVLQAMGQTLVAVSYSARRFGVRRCSTSFVISRVVWSPWRRAAAHIIGHESSLALGMTCGSSRLLTSNRSSSVRRTMHLTLKRSAMQLSDRRCGLSR